MKKFAMALVLVCAMSGSLFAGNMPTVGVADPPPPGNMPTVGATSSPQSSLVTTVILTIIGLI